MIVSKHTDGTIKKSVIKETYAKMTVRKRHQDKSLLGLAPEKGNSYGRNLDSLFGQTINKLKSTLLPFQDFLMILRFLFLQAWQLPGKNAFIT